MKTIRGRTTIFLFPKEGAASLDANEDKKSDAVGFRLVFDEAYRVCRGGSRDYGANYARAAHRNGDYPGYHRGDLGFRLVRDQT
jgi:formylglycine-generating enzyme required for sulfatase activity